MKRQLLGKAGLLTLGFLLLTSTVWAHTYGAHGANWQEGLQHPFSGIDHMLAMIAVGLWAAQRGGKQFIILPVTFLILMICSALMGAMGNTVPFIESGIAVSVLVLGLLIATMSKLPKPVSIILIGIFAVFHGQAHGTEFPQTLSIGSYIIGFVSSTALLHLFGFLTGVFVQRIKATVVNSRLLYQISGSALVLAGGILLI